MPLPRPTAHSGLEARLVFKCPVFSFQIPQFLVTLPGLTRRTERPRIMKVQIPEQLKADMPQTTWGKILSATPVVMAVVATMLAGLASSEMTRAQYERSLGAQQQSKAGDQWSFFQAKRLRGAFQRNSLDLLQNVVEVHPLAVATLKNSAEQLSAQTGQLPPERQAGAAKVKAELLALLESPAGQQALGFLEKGEVPPVPAIAPWNPSCRAALAGLEEGKPDAEMAALLARVNDQTLEAALGVARDQVQAFDLATKPLNQAIEQLEALLVRRDACLPPPASPVPAASAAAAPRSAAILPQRACGIPPPVMKSRRGSTRPLPTSTSCRCARATFPPSGTVMRSQRFFFGMLGAQLGVIISTFAIAARKRNLLWSLPPGAGLLAIAFAVYVYLCI